MVPFDGEAYIATVTRLAGEAPDPRTALVRIANMDPLGPTVSEPERRAVIAARLPVHDWPRRRLMITAVDAQTPSGSSTRSPPSGRRHPDSLPAATAWPRGSGTAA